MQIRVKEIPHEDQRLHDVGDWRFRDDVLTVKISKTGNPKYAYLLALHEIIEALLCKVNGVSQRVVDKWDKEHELMGDDPNAPYHNEHVFATDIEGTFADKLGVDWKEYEKVIEDLYNGSS